MKSFFAACIALSVLVHACPGNEHHDHNKRTIPASLTPPTRPLEWGDLNIIHTTDSHGWLLGHQKASFPEPNYSGTLGDFSSFVAHMKQQAKRRDVDLLLVDSGDLHDGTGLSDGFPVGSVDGHDANEFFKQLPYDVLAIGNHELYIYNITMDMHKNFAPRFKGRYLSSNAYITVKNDNGVFETVPVGSRFVKFKTQKGRRVTSLGVMFNFAGNALNTTVQKVEDMVNESWFKEAIQEEPDLFLLAGHMPVARDDWPLVFNAIRAVHPTTPILILGGHTHIRDCLQLDGRSMSLESGRYMETIGWMSVKFDKNSTKDLAFTRRYLDPNIVTYQYHTGLGMAEFPTATGTAITKGLKKLAKAFDLGFVFGTAPQDYTLNQVPPEANNSLLTLLPHAASVALAVNNTRASIPNIVIVNSGSQRFDIYAGEFTRNDQFTVSPFTNAFVYISNLTLLVASQVLAPLNNAGSSSRRRSDEWMTNDYAMGNIDVRYQEWLSAMSRRAKAGEERRANEAKTLGYVTNDMCKGVGDDIDHNALSFFDIPDFVASPAPSLPNDTRVDLVFTDFIASDILGIVNSLQTEKTYTAADVQSYSPLLTNSIWGVFAQAEWNGALKNNSQRATVN